MWIEAFERQSLRDGPLHRLDARWKLIATLAFVVAVVATPPSRWRALAAEGLVLALVIGLSGADPVALFRRWLAFLVLVGFLAVMLAMSHPAQERAAVFASTIAKNSLAFVAVLTLASVTPFPALLGALRRLRVPGALVATLYFMDRYLRVFLDELDRMSRARTSRTFRRSGRLSWGLLSNLISVQFVRALERGERVHAAMLARGWDGTLRTLDEADGR